MATVTFDHVTKKYGDVIAVNDFNLEIADGEFMVFVGPSGCGKTTSLRMIAGLEDITEGLVRIADRVVNDIPPKDRDIAMVFQSYALYPHMSVYDNLAFGLKLRKVDKKEIDRRVKEAAETIQLTTLLQRKPKELSGGMKQRVGFARALAVEGQLFDQAEGEVRGHPARVARRGDVDDGIAGRDLVARQLGQGQSADTLG